MARSVYHINEHLLCALVLLVSRRCCCAGLLYFLCCPCSTTPPAVALFVSFRGNLGSPGEPLREPQSTAVHRGNTHHA